MTSTLSVVSIPRRSASRRRARSASRRRASAMASPSARPCLRLCLPPLSVLCPPLFVLGLPPLFYRSIPSPSTPVPRASPPSPAPQRTLCRLGFQRTRIWTPVLLPLAMSNTIQCIHCTIAKESSAENQREWQSPERETSVDSTISTLTLPTWTIAPSNRKRTCDIPLTDLLLIGVYAITGYTSMIGCTQHRVKRGAGIPGSPWN